MQDTDSVMTNTPQREMSPYLSTKYDSPASSRASTPSPAENSVEHLNDDSKYLSDDENDEISVGCPSPALNSPKNFSITRETSPNYSSQSHERDLHSPSEYHEHKLHLETGTSCRCNVTEPEMDDYFKPLKKLKMVHIQSDNKRLSPTVDVEDRTDGVKSFSIMDILNHRPSTKPATANTRIVRPWDLDPETEAQQNFERFHRHLKAQQMALLRPEFAAFNAASYASETGSDRSSSVTSDCCSPDIVVTSSVNQQRRQQNQKSPGSTPLDALFQMTSKTFDSNTGESSADGQNHLNLFNNRQQPKKKRKSRTAFTNHQIFELEKRFLYQKYLSPADRDEIASSLGLSNAQVITWFQNRRAKLKRDMEELKKDVESAKILTAHKSFLENVQDLGILKKKAMINGDECQKGLMVSPEK